MSASLTFWNQPLKFLRRASHEKPAIFWSIIIGSMGPVSLFALPPIRHAMGDMDPAPVPFTYPGESGVFFSWRRGNEKGEKKGGTRGQKSVGCWVISGE